ncbi:LOW QUALITY PROTEIN: RCC1-like G exchanging factor-like protein [Amphiura filiformis]|uniref:LOW QUALITY PROTEIN: RCC1-like G exchanging factor-like protein n=1 Tax=Amphiura filiformis TaxID=82378 RepID=UPI003B22692D
MMVSLQQQMLRYLSPLSKHAKQVLDVHHILPTYRLRVHSTRNVQTLAAVLQNENKTKCHCQKLCHGSKVKEWRSNVRHYSEATRRERDAQDMDTYQYVGKRRTRQSRVYVWGYTYTGALGIKEFIFPKGKQKRPGRRYQSVPYTFHWDQKITSVACGYGFTLMASNTQQSTKVWGSGVNTDSQIGCYPKVKLNADGIQYIYTPYAVDVPLVRSRDTRVIQVACGRAHSLILTDKEGVFSLGNNSHGQCGRPVIENESYSKNPVVYKIKGIEGNVKQVVCGQDHSLFLTEEGTVYGCGWGADGQTGLGHYDSCSTPTLLAGDIQGEKITSIAAFADCCLAVSEKGDLFGWGNSEYNQLAVVTDETQVYEPRHLPFTSVGKVVSAASGGSTCALVNDAGDVFVWGYGILGKGPKLAESKEPQCIPLYCLVHTDSNMDISVTKVFCGLHHFAAITNKGDLYTWGVNGTGHLGNGSLQDQYFPLKVSVPAEVTDVACGVDHMVALAKTFI